MEYDEMLSWVLFYTSIFDAGAHAGARYADPAGLVRSQVVQTATGSVRIALNGSQSNRTMSGRFLSEFFGSGVQHIAFASNDIFATAERLKANGLDAPADAGELLRRSGGAVRPRSRADRPPARRRRLSMTATTTASISSSTRSPSPTASSSRSSSGGGGYRGFGATNAPIRLAAQTRASGWDLRLAG